MPEKEEMKCICVVVSEMSTLKCPINEQGLKKYHPVCLFKSINERGGIFRLLHKKNCEQSGKKI